MRIDARREGQVSARVSVWSCRKRQGIRTIIALSPVLLLRLAAALFARPRVRTHDLGYVAPVLVAAGYHDGVEGILTAKVVAARHCGGIILLFVWGGEGGARKGEGAARRM